MRALLGILSCLALAACAQGPDATQMTKAQEHAESECLVAVDSAKCKFENDLAGGYPVNLAQEP